MANNFAQAMDSTKRLFTNHVLPVLKGLFNNCKFVEIEGRADDEIAKDLDIYAGIDVYRVQYSTSSAIGIASRIQAGKAWRTFTVRRTRDSGAATEYEKRKYAIEHNTLYPKLTMQAYIQDNGSVVIGLVETEKLMEYIDKENPTIRRTGREQRGQASFFVCEWDKMRNAGYNVLEIISGDVCIASWQDDFGNVKEKRFVA